MSTYAGFDSAPGSLTQRALAHNFNLEERMRREAAQQNKDFYYGDQEKYLSLLNDDVEPMTMNLTRPIIGKRASMLYQKPLNREFDGPSSSVSFLEKVYVENDIDSFLQKVDLLSELTGSVLVHPAYDEEMETKVRLTLWDATQFTGVGHPMDPTKPEAISLIRLIDQIDDDRSHPMDKQPQVQRVLQSQIWTPDYVIRYDSYHGEERAVLVSQEDNELGFLPFVNFMGEEKADDLVGFAPGRHVREANHYINTILTHINFMVKMQSHTPIVLQGFKNGESVVVHPGRAINIPLDTAATTLDLNPKISETLELIEFLEDRIYTTSQVPRISVEGGEGESGRELMIRWHPLLQVFEDKCVRYDKYELELANTVLRMADLDPIDSIEIDWPAEDILPLSASEETLDRDVQLSIKTPIDEIMRRNPDMNEEEAWIEWQSNIQLNKNLTITNNEDQESDSVA